ncbi:MAG: DUF2784 domain-containing protein [Candidatus Latescibacterota bacterium]|jgi:hypothetical protein
MLRLADILFLLFHSLLIVFNLTGWIFEKTRRIHLVCISLTIASWVGLGFWFGFGYCPCTDWHWDVKRSLGETNLPPSWVKYYADSITGLNWDAGLIDLIVGVAGGAALLLSIGLNVRDRILSSKPDF